MAQSGINSKNGAEETVSLDEFERVPLKQRLKLLLASNRISVDSDVKSEKSDLGVGISDTVASVYSSSFDESFIVENPVKVKVECADSYVESSSASCMKIGSLAGTRAIHSEPEKSDEFLDELDHVVLKERLRRLLTSKCLGLSSTGRGGLFQFPSYINGTECNFSQAEAVEGDLTFGDRRHVVSRNQVHEIDRTLESGTSNVTVTSFCVPHQALGHCPQGNRSIHSDSLGTQRSESDSRKPLLSDDMRTAKTSAIPILANVKTEPPNYDEFQSSKETKPSQMSFSNFVLMKSEVQTAGDGYEDELDHMLLRERMKLLSSRDGRSWDIHQSSKCMSKMVPPASGYRPVRSKPTHSLKINRPRKRRKTVTDSVETAMQEDAPGLLQVLIEKGVSVDEIKLYSEPESNDALDDSSMNDNFAELEEVITKLFSQRDSLLKFGPLRCSKGEKASYCLECLFSLVEQARYLQFRRWPVEWGWCRDLQSFIFVFERHNRIVLERPEYGYATYFFELADSLPIDWQIKRLVTAMKLTSCSRVTLIENRALMVGDDLTEGEARVLMEYGWLPNTGLGTMLNYYDRVVHDRRNEKDSSEWRSKIGKLLMEGYNGGTIVPAGIPAKAMEYNAEHPLQVKLELS